MFSALLALALLQPQERPFRMGFTGFVHDFTVEAFIEMHEFVKANGDLLAHHIEGVPWAECLNDKPFSAKLEEEWKGKRDAVPPGGKVYLAVSPGRGELKPVDADKGLPIPKELAGKTYDHPLVKKAYLAYVRRAVAAFKPDYLAIGIEVNEMIGADTRSWKAYVDLHKHVYTEIKKEHKDLPVFASWTLHSMFTKKGAMLSEFKELMPYNDFVAVSTYPFFVEDAGRLEALDWMTVQFREFKKPFAMVETNDAAEKLKLPEAGVTIEGTPAKQEAYYKAMLELARKEKFVFVVSFVHRDYDALWEIIKKMGAPELFGVWRDCGFIDEKGNERPAPAVWKAYFALPLKP